MPLIAASALASSRDAADQLGRRDVGGVDAQRGAFRARDLKQILDQLVQLGGGLDDALQRRAIVPALAVRARAG